MELELNLKPPDLSWESSTEIAQTRLSAKLLFQTKLDSLAYVAKANKLYPTFIHRHRCTSVN